MSEVQKFGNQNDHQNAGGYHPVHQPSRHPRQAMASPVEHYCTNDYQHPKQLDEQVRRREHPLRVLVAHGSGVPHRATARQ